MIARHNSPRVPGSNRGLSFGGPNDPEEVDNELREAGLDPDAIGRRAQELVDRLSQIRERSRAMETGVSLPSVLADEQGNLLSGLRLLFGVLDVAVPDAKDIPPRGGLVPSIELAIWRTQVANRMVKTAIEVCERAMSLLEGTDRPAQQAK